MAIRFFDILFSGLALIALSPLLVVSMVILRFTGEGEIFFLQKRIGKNKKVIKLFKFATMYKNSENIGTGTVTVKDDPRVLPFGSFLRKTKINELPQLLNIFLGEMSVIGPRPLTPETFNFYTDDVKDNITKIKPGLSGIGSIVFRSEENLMSEHSDSISFYKDTIAPYKGMIEKWFVKKISLKNYFLLIFLTIWVVIKPNTRLHWKIYKDIPTPSNILIDKIYQSD